jgi:repressor LexA
MNYTPKQLEILRLIKRSQQERGYSPTYAEIAKVMDVSPVTVFEHIAALEKKGAIRRRKYEARSLEITDLQFDRTSEDTADDSLPLVGRIAAGRPIEAIENQENVALGSMFRGSGETYMLQVVGDSMIEDHICDGDFVVIERRETASNGEIVVAIVNDNEATLKRLYNEGDRFRLQPANHTMEPLYVTELKIQGVVRGIVRKCA